MTMVQPKSTTVARSPLISAEPSRSTVQASIIIVSYNGARYLDACLTSLVPELANEDEILLVDNASEDDGADLVEDKWPQVSVYRNQVNLGFAAACNQGANHAQRDVLVFLNQDTCVQPGWLSELLAPMVQDPTVGLVTSRLLLMSNSRQVHMCGQDIHFTGLAFGRGFSSPAGRYVNQDVVGAISGASFAIRRELWYRLGGFDPTLFMYYEDTDLSWRARLAGYSSICNPASNVLHDHNPHQSSLALYYSERNRIILLMKNWKCSTLLLLLPSLVLAEIIDWGYVLLVGGKGIYAKLRALFWLAGKLPVIWRLHKQVQAKRQKPDWVVMQSFTSQLEPKFLTGGWLGGKLVALCNLWFRLHYRLLLSVMQKYNL
jgi:GT2 family glycosyltransferase